MSLRRERPTTAARPGATRVAIPLASSRNSVTFAVRVVTRAGRTGVAGARGEALLVRLAAPPVDNAANEALTALLADMFGRPRRDVSIVSGLASRSKRVAIEGATPDAVAAVLEAAVNAA